MSELYAIEVPLAPNQEERFLMCFSGVFSNLSDVKFVKLGKVITGNRSQGFKARHNLDFCKHIVDRLRQLVKDGSPQKWLGSARVVRFIPATSQLDPVYTGVQEVAPIVDNPSLVHLAFDGTYRKIADLFQKTPRGWKFPYSILADSFGVPRADWISAATKTEIIEHLFDNNYQLSRDIVVTYPLADPSQIPEPPAPVVEYVPTQAELDAVPALNFGAWQLLPAEDHKRKYIFDPIYREGFRKMLVVQEAEEQKAAALLEQEQAAETIEKMKKQFIRHDENERLKGAHL